MNASTKFTVLVIFCLIVETTIALPPLFIRLNKTNFKTSKRGVALTPITDLDKVLAAACNYCSTYLGFIETQCLVSSGDTRRACFSTLLSDIEEYRVLYQLRNE